MGLREEFILQGILNRLLQRTALRFGAQQAGTELHEASTYDPDRLREQLVRSLDSLPSAFHPQPVASNTVKLSAIVEGRATAILRLIVEQHVNPACSLHSVAAAVALSPWRVDHILIEATGHGFRYHLRQVRSEHARELLKDERLRIKEVAVAVGYNSTSVFGRHFRRKTGMTPTAWRRLAASLMPGS